MDRFGSSAEDIVEMLENQYPNLAEDPDMVPLSDDEFGLGNDDRLYDDVEIE